MILKDFLPIPVVRDVVRNYRIVHFRFDPKVVIPVKAYPPRLEHSLSFRPFDQELVIHPLSKKQIESQPSMLSGQQTGVLHRYPGQNFLTVQIIFQPTGLFKLTRIPATELTNQLVDGETVLGTSLQEVNEKLRYAKSYAEMISVLDVFVQSFIKRSSKRTQHPIDAVSSFMLKQNGIVSLDQLASDACLSIRQFQRKFEERTGIPPKLFWKITRFDRAFRLKNRFPELDWLTISNHCGYYDYPHLSKDYMAFTGKTPYEFHVIENGSPERTIGLGNNFYETSMD